MIGITFSKKVLYTLTFPMNYTMSIITFDLCINVNLCSLEICCLLWLGSFYTYIPFDYIQKAVNLFQSKSKNIDLLNYMTAHVSIDDSGWLKAQTHPFSC